MSDDRERMARVRLSVWAEPGQTSVTHSVADLGAEEVVAFLCDRRRPGGMADDLVDQLEAVDPGAVLDRARAAGLRFVTPADGEWPTGLDDLARAPALHDRGGVPVGLWCRGPLRLDEVTRRAVALVGSRSATTYGTSVADDLGGHLAREGWTTVSGAAFGIDQAAHRGAMRAGGSSVAVLACGADRVYPTAHRQLIDHHAQVGLVVAESPPGGAPTRIRFLARNRLIAALSTGTVVVEAAVRSGALNTASWAAGMQRVLMGVPGPLTSAQSAGVHQLVRNRDAVLVTRGEDVLEAVAPVGTHLTSEPRGPERARDRLTSRQRQVLDAVPVVQGAPSRSIAATAGLPHQHTQDDLRVLLEAGFVEHGTGRWRLCPEPDE